MPRATLPIRYSEVSLSQVSLRGSQFNCLRSLSDGSGISVSADSTFACPGYPGLLNVRQADPIFAAKDGDNPAPLELCIPVRLLTTRTASSSAMPSLVALGRYPTKAYGGNTNTGSRLYFRRSLSTASRNPFGGSASAMTQTFDLPADQSLPNATLAVCRDTLLGFGISAGVI